MDGVAVTGAESVALRYRLLQTVLAILLLCYGLQIFSPLRLNTDSIVLLSTADSVARGGGFLDEGAKTVFPPGYPAAVALMQHIGIAGSPYLISLNLVFLVGGLFAVHHLLRRHFVQSSASYICALFLLSFVVIKHVTIPITDIVFFGVAMIALDLMDFATVRYEGRKLALSMLGVWVLVIVSISIRRVGVALLPPLIFAVLFTPTMRKSLSDVRSGAKWTAGIVAILVAAATAWVIMATSSVGDFAHAASRPRFELLPKLISFRLSEFGELAMNAPASRLSSEARFIGPWIGLIMVLLIVRGMLMRRREISTVEIFFCSYAGILSIWPFADPRFWLPVLALMMGYVACALRNVSPRGPLRFVVWIYCVCFVLLGVVSLGYSTRLTFAGSRFPSMYGDGTLRASYCAAYGWCSEKEGKVGPKVVRLLRTYR